MSATEIAKAIGCSRGSVLAKARSLGIKLVPEKPTEAILLHQALKGNPGSYVSVGDRIDWYGRRGTVLELYPHFALIRFGKHRECLDIYDLSCCRVEKAV